MLVPGELVGVSLSSPSGARCDHSCWASLCVDQVSWQARLPLSFVYGLLVRWEWVSGVSCTGKSGWVSGSFIAEQYLSGAICSCTPLNVYGHWDWLLVYR